MPHSVGEKVLTIPNNTFTKQEYSPIMSTESPLVIRSEKTIKADVKRVISLLFLPSEEIAGDHILRTDSVIDHIIAMPSELVHETLKSTCERFCGRHDDLLQVFAENFKKVSHRLKVNTVLSEELKQLIGSYFTKEYSIEGAALFNPSAVKHPDQSGLAPGELRVIMSLRAVGEGHVSSLEFRTAVFNGLDIFIDPPEQHLTVGTPSTSTMTKTFLKTAFAEVGDPRDIIFLLSLLPEVFIFEDLNIAIASVNADAISGVSSALMIEEVKRIFLCSYKIEFPIHREISARVLFPHSPDESHGMEDARFTRFDDGETQDNYWATYTAYDGSRVTPHLLQTRNFQDFAVTRLVGPSSKNKGMALFPRKIEGLYYSLSRWDKENISIATSRDALEWGEAIDVDLATMPWEKVQRGNCGSPIELPEGWLVFTHGVGPMREYGIGAILLDLADPTQVIGSLEQPLLTANEEEREGYVPNVVYSCGALLHNEKILLPYAGSDCFVKFAFIDLPSLLGALVMKKPMKLPV